MRKLVLIKIEARPSRRPWNSKYRSIPYWGLLCVLVTAGCFFNVEHGRNTQVTPSEPGMVALQSKGKTIFQGAAGGQAAPNESPVLENTFTYDFQMDLTEVTQQGFRLLMGRDPVSNKGAFGQGDQYPVYNVSWFDAVLFCNARSKKAGLDTVYTYTRITQAPSGTAYDLTGLTVHLEKAGFRLPTEAEWEFAAHAGQDSDFPWGDLKDSVQAKEFAWFSGNAQGTTHPVAGLKANGFGLYDMAGNVMEWVNDWKGVYPAKGTEDFAGSRDPSLEFDVPVKGGAFKYGLREMRPANRSATYTTLRSATAEYVGFRCALGAILKPRYSTPDGTLSVTDAVKLEITRIRNLVGGSEAKLVFVNATASVRHLVYVDFRKSPVRVQEFADVLNVFYPVISPDGNWVAFGTALEGAASGSSLYIRRLDDSAPPIDSANFKGASIKSQLIGPGFIPRWWVNPATRDTFLVYVNSAVDNTQPQWASTQTLMQKMQGGEPVGGPQTLADGGFHDGRSRDGRWLATGFRLLKVRDEATGKSRVLFTAPDNGKSDGDTSQVCNVSIAPDSSGRTLFLDFGYEGNSKVTGSFYDIHQVAFLADPDGKVIRWFKAPREEKGWEDLEWSNRPDFAVSAATDEADGHHRLYLLNLKDSVATLLASGSQLATPGLWLGELPDSINTSGLELDSAGQYNEPGSTDTRVVFADKMHLFWKTYKVLDGVFLGSSQMADGLDPGEIKSLRSYNLAYGAGDWIAVESMLRNYVLPNCPNIRMVGISVPIGWFKLPNGDFAWTSSIVGTKGYQYDLNNDFWKSGLPTGFVETAIRIPSSSLPIDSLGLYGFPSNGWGGSPLGEFDGPPWDASNPNFQSNLKLFEQLVADLSAKKIHCLFLVFPQSPVYKSMKSFSIHGPDWITAKDILLKLSDLQKRYPYFHLLDFNMNGEHDYVDADAFDSMHLSRSGAKKLSARLNEEIKKIQNP